MSFEARRIAGGRIGEPKEVKVERGRTEDERKKFGVLDGGKDKSASLAEIETASDFTIEEGRTFGREEIIRIIEKIAAEDGFKNEQLEITKEIYDPEGKLLTLTMRVKSGRTKGEGFGHIWYDFLLKGNRGGDYHSLTEIFRTVSEKDRPDELIPAGIVGRYKNGKWELTPNEFVPQAAHGTFEDT